MTAKAKEEFLEAMKRDILQWSNQSPDLSPKEDVFHSSKKKWRGATLPNKEQLKVAAAKAQEEVQHLVMGPKY